MSLVVDFPHPAPRVESRPPKPACCPLCGAGFRLGFTVTWCRLGACAVEAEPGSIEAARIEANRTILRGDLFEIELALLAAEIAIAAAKRLGTPFGSYLEHRFVLVLRKRILIGYVAE